jgi:hypothetical protein
MSSRDRFERYSVCVKARSTPARCRNGHGTNRVSYRSRNWKEYNTALCRRGSLTIWLDEDAAASWLNNERTGKRGHPKVYSESAIQSAATLGEVYRQPLRQTTGLLRSIMKMLGLSLRVPHYSTLSRRRKSLTIDFGLNPCMRSNEPLHLVIDSTGFKVFGEGEWKVRKHGWSKRRTWRKLHLAVNANSHEITAAVVTTPDVTDGEILPDLLEETDELRVPVSHVAADGAYDQSRCYEAIRDRGAQAVIPPRKGARIWQHANKRGAEGNKLSPHPRDQNLRLIRKHGRAKWKRESGYHRRSLAETAMFRQKTIFGDRLSARSFEGQECQLLVRCAALNRMTALGMPDSYRADIR